MLIPIADPADPRIADYIGIRDAHAREQHLTVSDLAPSCFIAEGELVVRQLMASKLAVRSVLLTPQRVGTMRDVVEGTASPVYVVEQGVMNAVAGFNIHRGVLAAGERGRQPELAELLARGEPLVILEDLSNHDNIGGIFRAAAGLGGRGVLLSPRCADPLYRKAIRVSMGTVFHLPFARVEPWPGVLGQVRAAGYTVVAMTPGAGARPIGSVQPPARVALMLGAEGPGLTEGAMAAADVRVRIPIDPAVDSLNVVTAAAIGLHRLVPGT